MKNTQTYRFVSAIWTAKYAPSAPFWLAQKRKSAFPEKRNWNRQKIYRQLDTRITNIKDRLHLQPVLIFIKKRKILCHVPNFDVFRLWLFAGQRLLPGAETDQAPVNGNMINNFHIGKITVLDIVAEQRFYHYHFFGLFQLVANIGMDIIQNDLLFAVTQKNGMVFAVINDLRRSGDCLFWRWEKYKVRRRRLLPPQTFFRLRIRSPAVSAYPFCFLAFMNMFCTFFATLRICDFAASFTW